MYLCCAKFVTNRSNFKIVVKYPNDGMSEYPINYRICSQIRCRMFVDKGISTYYLV